EEGDEILGTREQVMPEISAQKNQAQHDDPAEYLQARDVSLRVVHVGGSAAIEQRIDIEPVTPFPTSPEPALQFPIPKLSPKPALAPPLDRPTRAVDQPVIHARRPSP